MGRTMVGRCGTGSSALQHPELCVRPEGGSRALLYSCCQGRSSDLAVMKETTMLVFDACF